MSEERRRDLQRFVTAQADCYHAALDELRAGRKRTHWMWFVFPQLDGLGSSPTARFYALRDLDEARAYLDHPVLGARLRECVAASLEIRPADALTVFGSPDDLKLRSSLTLFARAAGAGEPLFESAVAHWFGGTPDPRTLELLAID